MMNDSCSVQRYRDRAYKIGLVSQYQHVSSNLNTLQRCEVAHAPIVCRQTERKHVIKSTHIYIAHCVLATLVASPIEMQADGPLVAAIQQNTRFAISIW